MASEVAGLAAVSASAAGALYYARFATSRLTPGIPRLAALLPVLLLLPVLPFAFSSIHLRTISAFFLVWLCSFKLLLLAAGHGPLDPALPLVRFVACAALPIKVRDEKQQQQQRSSSRSLPSGFMLSYAAKAALFAVLVSVRCYRARLPEYAVPVFDGAHVYLLLELFLASAAAVARALLGAELEPQFDRPYLAYSLRDFWGRRWNLMVPGVLRPCVYRPVRARLGAAAGVLAAFLVSGLMHEVMFYYITLEAGTGEVTAFFALHGACAVAERWCAAQRLWRDWRPLRPVATALTLAFVTATGSWLFFAPVIRSGLDKAIVAECEGMLAFLERAGRNLAAAAHLV
ncbi:putative long-chain-alcohol O-fatty-acyltransferase 4 [Dichanthelium oligosanthes]|uniref:Putative long-chain-alcohol O-fatty-acyltransferase 4 n=1 Tax=Dichanthelium oligosanthes TaxID=888268 RepID=A0A1E5W2A7_9POAL|nr:putative long-chain-alcohol O-fatty-acyltransferase 4 [Dichanthelium oligosanthes]